jgi:hypothetical protein
MGRRQLFIAHDGIGITFRFTIVPPSGLQNVVDTAHSQNASHGSRIVVSKTSSPVAAAAAAAATSS